MSINVLVFARDFNRFCNSRILLYWRQWPQQNGATRHTAKAHIFSMEIPNYDAGIKNNETVLLKFTPTSLEVSIWKRFIQFLETLGIMLGEIIFQILVTFIYCCTVLEGCFVTISNTLRT